MKDKYVDNIATLFKDIGPLFEKNFRKAFHKSEELPGECTKSQNRVISIISHRGKMIPSELGKAIDMRKGSLTPLIDGLEEKGLIIRIRGEKDRRKTWLQLTEEGEKYAKLLDEHFKQVVGIVFENATEEEKKDFEESMGTIIRILEKLQ